MSTDDITFDIVGFVRLKGKMSEDEFAAVLGCSRTAVRSIIEGRISPKVEYVINACEYFKLCPSDLFVCLPSPMFTVARLAALRLEQTWKPGNKEDKAEKAFVIKALRKIK